MRDMLIERRPGAEIDAFGPLGANAGEPSGLAPWMNPAIRRLDLLVVAPRYHEQSILVRGQRPKDLRNIESPVAFRRPVRHAHSHGHVNSAEAAHWRYGGGKCGDHSVEERQRETRPEPSQNSAPREILLGDDHDSLLFIWNGTLF